MDVKNAYLPETAHRHFEVRLFNRCVEPFERPFREHWHFLFEAALIKGGSGVYTTQRAVYPIRPGDVFLFACNEIHCVTRIDPGAPLQLMNIHIDPSYLWPENGAPLTPRFLAMPFSHSAAFENRLAAALFGIPAVKGMEFGLGFGSSRLHGSENNDPFAVEDGAIVAESNRSGGILGGITTGMPVTLRVAIKPTPSISQAQRTVSLSAMEDTELVIRGRHDPCIAHRAVPVVEAVTATVLLDLLLEGHHGTF